MIHWDGHGFPGVTSDDTPIPTTPREVRAVLLGLALSAVAWLVLLGVVLGVEAIR